MKITIITVTYNAASVLQRTLDSVSRQTHQDIEHLIIDGASKDGTVAMAEAYKSKSPYQVVIQSEPDRGLYDAMNKGLRMATGDYLVFLNAGDTLHTDDTLEVVHGEGLRIVPSFTVIRLLSMLRGNSSTCAVCALPRNCLGARFARACWYATKPSMCAQILPSRKPTTCNIAIRQTLTGASG